MKSFPDQRKMNEKDPYADIRSASRPKHQGDAFSLRHPPMSLADRAKIFSPFAALKGYEEAIDRAAEESVLQLENPDKPL